jgi:hypothetical protein
MYFGKLRTSSSFGGDTRAIASAGAPQCLGGLAIRHVARLGRLFPGTPTSRSRYYAG